MAARIYRKNIAKAILAPLCAEALTSRFFSGFQLLDVIMTSGKWKLGKTGPKFKNIATVLQCKTIPMRVPSFSPKY